MEVVINMDVVIDVDANNIEEANKKIKNFECEGKIRNAEEYYINNIEKTNSKYNN